jgi:hypothetical protein
MTTMNKRRSGIEDAISQIERQYHIVVEEDPIEKKRKKLSKILTELANIRESLAKATNAHDDGEKTYEDIWDNFEKLPQQQQDYYNKLSRQSADLEVELYPGGSVATRRKELEYWENLKKEHKNDAELYKLIEDQQHLNGFGGTAAEWEELRRRKAAARESGKDIWW